MTAIGPFPLKTYVNISNFCCYYAFGNTPPEDLASCINGVENPRPEILSLGCGDMRNCFYTILKHFGPSSEKSASSFRGMNFILNDASAGILARNVLQLLLAVETPKNPLKAKEHFKKAWGIFYNHGLTDEEQNLLQKSLNQLVCWTESEEKWKETEENPLRNVVSFHSADTMRQMREMWILWIAGYPHSMDEMFRQRRKSLFRGLEVKNETGLRAEMKAGAKTKCSVLIGTCSVHQVSDAEVSAAEEEIVNYAFEGSVSDESLPRKHVNPTLFDRKDWKYVFHYLSMPFLCFHQSFFFKESVLKKNGLDSEFLSLLPVRDKQFHIRPLFSNSFQQFALWLISVRNALNFPDIGVSFLFHCEDCLDFLVSHSISLKTGNIKAVGFEVIHSSNLIDHVGLPNLVLAARDVLKPNGFLFTALMRLPPGMSLSQYVTSYFGVPFERFPILFNVRCIGHDGPFGDGILANPTSEIQELSSGADHQHVSLIWQRVEGMPVSMKSLDSCHAKSLVAETLASLIIPQMKVDRHHLTNAVAVCKSLLILVSQMSEEECSWKNPEFWEEYCDLLKKKPSISSNLWELQTMFLLHGLHIHLKVGRKNCPICQNVPVSEFIALYELQVAQVMGDILSMVADSNWTAYYEVFIHENDLPSFSSGGLDEENLPSGTMKVRCVAGSSGESGPLTLRFHFPRKFGDPGGGFRVSAFQSFETTEKTLVEIPLARDLLLLHAVKQSDDGFLFEQAGTHVSAVAGDQWTLSRNVLKVDEGDLSSCLYESIFQLEIDVAASDLSPKRISERKIEIGAKKLKNPISLVYPVSVNFNNLKIRVNRKGRTIAVKAERTKHVFSEQDPLLFYYNPNNFLANPLSNLSKGKLRVVVATCQISIDDIKGSFMGGELWKMKSLKRTLLDLFLDTTDTIYEFISKRHGAALVVHQRLIDVEHVCPLLDVSYWKMESSQMNLVMSEWAPFAKKQGRQLMLNEADLDMFDRMMVFFKKKTVLGKGDERNMWKGSAAPIRKMKVKSFFERAVLHHLPADLVNLRNFTGYFGDIPGENNIGSKPLLTCSYCHSASAHPLICYECGETTTEWTCGKEKCSDALLNDSEHKKQCKGRKLKPACKNCGAQSETLKKCSGCGFAEYCNGKCQAAHWPSHKKECKAGSVGIASKPACKNCGNQSESLKKCSGCGLAEYCNIKCQAADWPSHKKECKAGSDKTDSQLKSKCGNCKKESTELKLCKGCGVVRYCNVQCQKSHWVKHKPNCKK